MQRHSQARRDSEGARSEYPESQHPDSEPPRADFSEPQRLRSADADEVNADKLFGLLHFTCGLPTPIEPDVNILDEPRAITLGDVLERRRSLRSWLVAPKSQFQLDGITDLIGVQHRQPPPPHGWLIDLSRHTYHSSRDFDDRRRDTPLPPGFPGALDWHHPDLGEAAPWRHYLRLQRARDDASKSLTSVTDCNDYLIRPPKVSADGMEPGSLWELQYFFCEFLALRRAAIFASQVSERIYSIWLPPGVITLKADPQRDGQDSCFALLPVVTVVRRPYRINWRYAMSVGVLFVPWWPSGPGGSCVPNRPRPMSPREIVDIVASTGGNSTYVRAPADLDWPLASDSPLFSYFNEITSDHLHDFCKRYRPPTEREGRVRHPTIRHWLELLLLTAAEYPRRQDERDDDRIYPEQQVADDRSPPDEVLRSLRMNGFWSATLVTDLKASGRASPRIAQKSWWPNAAEPQPQTAEAITAGLPAPLAEVFALFAERDRAFPATPDDRIDMLASGGRAYLTWRIPREHIIVTAYDRESDQFPSFSSLNLAGWFACMAVGVTCARQTMHSLIHDTEQLHDIVKLSRLGHERIMDLEDVYDLDVAWPAYADFYRRLRSLLGVEREYRDIKDRLSLLFRFAEVEQITRTEQRRSDEIRLRSIEQQLAAENSNIIARVAAYVGAGILLVSAMTLFAAVASIFSDFHGLSLLISLIAIAVLTIALGFAGNRIRLHFRALLLASSGRRTEIRELLAQLADSPGN